MRTKVWKDALYAGTWVTPKGQVFDCGDDELRHFHDRTKAMLSNGSPLPWVWEHQHDGKDDIGLSANDLLAKWSQNTGGHIHDVRFAPSGNALELLLDVDEATKDKDGKTDRQKLESIKYVSPDIRHNWRDRNGPASDEIGPYWPGGSFAHIAITPLPVQYPQNAFSFESAKRLSLSAAGVDVSLSSARLQTVKHESIAMSAGHKPAGLGGGQFCSATEGGSWDQEKWKDDVENLDKHLATPGDHAKHVDAYKRAKTKAAKIQAIKDLTDHLGMHGHAMTVEASLMNHKAGSPQGNARGAKLSAKDDDMPLPDEKDENLNEPLAAPDLSALPPPPPPAIPDAPANNMGGDAHLIQQFAEIVKDLGVEIHTSPEMSLKSAVEHFCTAFKTHKATKGGGADDDNLNQPEPEQTPEPTTQEPEVAESPPIMMSATTKPTDREIKLARKLVKSSNDNLRQRIGVLHRAGYIDDSIKGELEKELGGIKLSMADLTDDGDLKPTSVSIQVSAFERLMKSGKPGSFIKAKASSPAGAKHNPHKPISSAVALSAAADEEVVEAPDAHDNERASRQAQEEAGDELMALAGCRPSKNGKH